MILKDVPGVGKYKESEKPYTDYKIVPKSRTAFMPKAKSPRFTEQIAK